MANQSFNLEIEISSNIEGAVKGFNALKDSLKGFNGLANGLSKGLDSIAKSLDDLEKRFKKFGRELTQNVTAPIAALAALSLKHIFDEAVAGRGTAEMNKFAASVQNLKRDFNDLLKDIGQQIAPFFNTLISYVRVLIQAYRQLSPETKSMIITIAAFAAALGPASLAVSSFLSVAVQLTKVFSTLIAFGPKLVSLFLNPYVAIGALAIAIASLTNLILNLNKAGAGIGESIVLSLDLAASYIEKTFYPLIATVLRKIQQQSSKIADENLFDTILGEKNKGPSIASRVADGFDELGAAFDQRFEKLRKEINEKLAPIGTDIGDSLSFGMIKGINSVIDKFKEIQEAANNIKTKPLVTDADVKRLNSIAQTAHQIKLSFAGGLSDAFLDFAEGVKTAEQAFNDFARSFLRQILQMIMQQAIFNSLSQFSWFSRGASAAAGASYISGPSTIAPTAGGFAEGGLVNGPGSGTSDSIAARLSNGEFVMTAASVQKFGAGFFDRINNLAKGPSRVSSKFGHFADGGLVTSSQQAPQVVIENSGTEKTVARTEFDPVSAITTVVLEDLSKNGPISKSIQSSYGMKRGGFR